MAFSLVFIGSDCTDPNESVICKNSTHGLNKKIELKEGLINNFAVYLIKMAVGTPAQTVDFVADTGSSNVVTTGEACTGCKLAHTYLGLYAPKDSTSATGPTNGPTLEYGQGESGTHADTEVWKDKIGLTCEDEAVTHSIMNLTSSTGINNSILGLAYPALTDPSGEDTFFESLVKQYPNTPNQFTLTLCGMGNHNSLIEFGGTDPRLSADDAKNIKWVKTPKAGEGETAKFNFYWLEPTEVSLNDTAKTVLGSYRDTSGAFTGPQPIVDSGTTLMLLPSGIYTNLVTSLKSNSVLSGMTADWWKANPNITHQFSDADLAKLPSIMFAMKDKDGQAFELEVRPKHYLKIVKDNERMFAIKGEPSGTAILGLPFLENFSITFQQDLTNDDNNLMGFVLNNDKLCSTAL